MEIGVPLAAYTDNLSPSLVRLTRQETCLYPRGWKSMLDLTRLEVFLHAAETLSFSEAAQRLHLSQPTVSHHIKKLEEEFGGQLFLRAGHEIELTEAGRLLVPHARKLLREAMGVQQMMHSIGDRVVGSLRIACSTTTGKYILPQFASRFRQRHPGVSIRILRCTQDDVVPTVLGKDADLGVVSFDACSDEMDCQEFFTDHIILISPVNQPWTATDNLEPSDFLGVPFILGEPGDGTRRELATELAKHDITLDDLNIFLELGNAEAIVKTVELGFGLAFVPKTAAGWALDQGTVVEIPVSSFELHRRVFMIRKKLHSANRAMESFWAFVHDPSNADLLRIP
jgi:DNA-binding transcriptional LysR family regulator